MPLADAGSYADRYALVAVFVALGVLLPVAALTVGRLLRPHRPVREKLTTYESGNEPLQPESRVRFNVRYYVFALMFVVFDVETAFMYPWAVAYGRLGLFAVIEMFVFVVLLVIGFAYAWKKKVLTWTSI
ncbi:MAG: NADH:ubiquinone oxidoreductase subunit A [Candidatus Reconcilbacillus cellulovorans]|uniref:NADH-quinone oxidoreductase subunit A n=1 Tax=Candidatus Reconcilbacillus cellulovorans TaxID=1906605 RepID=A0A2A6E0B9_9BACL|nr:MAG: NADH:ubiquinone oxidoreductase subunit A [Candidatus Reconcilbacillus cellulovorans]